MSRIEIEGVSYAYRTQREGHALREVTCSIEAGSFVGITGPSDAGKTTFCRLLPGYIPNFYGGRLEGSVTVDGVDVSETTIGELSAAVGLVFENPFDQLTGASMTVLEEVAYGLENMGLPRDEIVERVYESLETVGIADLVGRNPQQLSGGQSQRLALASILAMEPDVLVLDEPTSQLDPAGTEEVFDVVSRMEDAGYTIVIVSQELERLAPHLDRLLVFEDGRVRTDGPPAEVLAGEAGDEELFMVPDVVEIGTRLRDAGAVDPGTPVPLRLEDSVAELRPRVALDRADGGGAADPSIERDGDPVVSLEDVHYEYSEDIRALRGVSVDLYGGCVCIVGQNGAGKTTLAKHLNGLLKPTDGTVRVDGTDTADRRVAQLAREVGFSFQNPDDQLFHDTVAAEVRYGPENLGMDDEVADAQVAAAIERLDLGDVRESNPYDLGLPRRKRVAVASVLAMDTPVVVLDEPTGGQDAPGTRLLGRAVEELVDDGTLVIVITHDVAFARDHADRVIALRGGEVLLDGDPRAVFGRTDTLAETHVEPPKVTRMGELLDLPETVLTIDELFAYVDTA